MRGEWSLRLLALCAALQWLRETHRMRCTLRGLVGFGERVSVSGPKALVSRGAREAKGGRRGEQEIERGGKNVLVSDAFAKLIAFACLPFYGCRRQSETLQRGCESFACVVAQ